MAILIQQTEQEIAQAYDVNRNSQLQGIRLCEAYAWAAPLDDPRPLGDSLSLELVYKPDGHNVNAHRMLLTVSFLFRIFESTDSDQKNFVKVNCKFEANYSLRPKYSPDLSFIKAFHSGNAVFNCWPFFREYVQNTVVRMGYPAPPIEFLHLAKKEQEIDKGQNAPALVNKSTRKSGRKKPVKA